MKEFAFTFSDGAVYFYIKKRPDAFDLSIGDKNNGHECFVSLSEEDYKKMISNFTAILEQ